jgi:hypothetical protein
LLLELGGNLGGLDVLFRLELDALRSARRRKLDREVLHHRRAIERNVDQHLLEIERHRLLADDEFHVRSRLDAFDIDGVLVLFLDRILRVVVAAAADQQDRNDCCRAHAAHSTALILVGLEVQ